MSSGHRLLAVVVLIATASVVRAKCDPATDPDKSDIANARAAVASSCDCAAPSHHGYLECATAAAALALKNKGCTGVVRRCASKSTCGEPDSVTCCRTSGTGKTSCTVKRDASKCVAPKRGSACVGKVPSCCDACAAGGCAPSPACTSMPFPECGGTCPDGGVCGPSPGLDGCRCNVPTSPCGDTGPTCNGTCPSGEQCAALGPGPFNACGCIPAGSTPCGSPGAPICGGVCPGSLVCRPAFQLPIFGGGLGCFCANPGACGQGGAGCPNGFGCAVAPPSPQAFCAPIRCGSDQSYPTCGGSCVEGAECVPIAVEVSPPVHFCVCAVPSACDAGCGGYDCPTGEVCSVSVGAQQSCGCGAP